MQIQHPFLRASMLLIIWGAVADAGCQAPDLTLETQSTSTGSDIATADPEERLSFSAWQNVQPIQTLSGYSDSPHSIFFIQFQPDEETLVSGGFTDNRASGSGPCRVIINVWNLDSGEMSQSTPEAFAETAIDGFMAQNSKLISVSSNLRRVDIWDLQTLSVQQSISTDYPVELASLSRDGRTLVLGSRNEQSIEVWRLEPEPQVIQTFNTDHEGYRYTPDGADSPLEVPAVLFKMQLSPDGSHLATTGLDKRIKLWDVQTGGLLRTLSQAHGSPIHSLSFRSDNQVLASGSADKTIKVWNVETGNVLHTFPEQVSNVTGLSFSPIGNVLVSSDMNYNVKLWDADTGELMQTLMEGPVQEGGIEVTPVFSPSGDRLAAVLPDGRIQVWQVGSSLMSQLAKPLRASGATVSVAPGESQSDRSNPGSSHKHQCCSLRRVLNDTEIGGQKVILLSD